MCGIAGYVGRVERPNALLKDMANAIAHRGPDGEGSWSDEHAGLAHRRLSIIDLTETGSQPMTSPDQRYVVSFNGEIYNYLEIRQELTALGSTFRGASDTEVLLEAYKRWGEKCLSKLDGMWAFAIWDRQRREMFLSRDRFGEKPLYYGSQGQVTFFASEVKALLAAGLTARLDVQAMADFIAERVTDHDDTSLFAGIRQLPAAHCAILSDKEFRIWRYWSIDAPPESEIADDPIPHIRELLIDSVRVRLRADTEVGCLLSGGVDSTSIASIMAQVLPERQKFKVYSTRTGHAPGEEAGIDAFLATNANAVGFVERPKDTDFFEDLDQCIWHQEQPIADGSMLAHFRLMRMIRKSGVKVVLTGQGADEVFAGYRDHFPAHAREMVRTYQFGEAARSILAGGMSKAGRYAVGALSPVPVARFLRTMRARRALNWIAPDLPDPGVFVRSGQGGTQDRLAAALIEAIEVRSLPGFLRYEDRNSMAHGVETRLPFLYHNLVSYALAVPAKKKMSDGMAKLLLRQAMRGITPDSVLDRREKNGYPAPLQKWLRSARQFLLDSAPGLIKDTGFLNAARWSMARDKFLQGDSEFLDIVWRGLIVALWHKRFFTGRIAA